eukprot:g82990.t1
MAGGETVFGVRRSSPSPWHMAGHARLLELTHRCRKVICVGRNYAAHARELQNPLPASPFVFLKPPSAFLPIDPGMTTQRPPGYVAHNISRDPDLVDCTVDLCGHIGLHSPSPSPQCG